MRRIRSKCYGPISHEVKLNVILGRSHEPKYHPFQTRRSRVWYEWYFGCASCDMCDILPSVTCFHGSQVKISVISHEAQLSLIWKWYFASVPCGIGLDEAPPHSVLYNLYQDASFNWERVWLTFSLVSPFYHQRHLFQNRSGGRISAWVWQKHQWLMMNKNL